MTADEVRSDTVAVNIIAGLTGAGKTTYALALAERIGGMRFSIDHWMQTLFWMDSPRAIQYEWTVERIKRCEQMIFYQVEQLAGLGIPSILDLGFTRTEHRQKFARLARNAGLPVRLHWLDLSPDARWMRVQKRNVERGETYSINVDREMFDFMETIWEAPTPQEMRACNGLRQLQADETP